MADGQYTTEKNTAIFGFALLMAMTFFFFANFVKYLYSFVNLLKCQTGASHLHCATIISAHYGTNCTPGMKDASFCVPFQCFLLDN